MSLFYLISNCSCKACFACSCVPLARLSLADQGSATTLYHCSYKDCFACSCVLLACLMLAQQGSAATVTFFCRPRVCYYNWFCSRTLLGANLFSADQGSAATLFHCSGKACFAYSCVPLARPMFFACNRSTSCCHTICSCSILCCLQPCALDLPKLYFFSRLRICCYSYIFLQTKGLLLQLVLWSHAINMPIFS
jgi:hypothetical protein